MILKAKFLKVTQKLHIILIWTKLKLNGCKLNLISLQIDVRYKMELRFESLEIKPCGLGSRIRDMEAEWRLRVITD